MDHVERTVDAIKRDWVNYKMQELYEIFRNFLTQPGDDSVKNAQLLIVLEDVIDGRRTNADYTDAMCVMHGQLGSFFG